MIFSCWSDVRFGGAFRANARTLVEFDINVKIKNAHTGELLQEYFDLDQNGANDYMKFYSHTKNGEILVFEDFSFSIILYLHPKQSLTIGKTHGESIA